MRSVVFPDPVETDVDGLTLRRFCREVVDPRDLYDLLGSGAPGADEVFEHVPQEPYPTAAAAREDLREAAQNWAAATVAEYAVLVADDGSDGDPQSEADAGPDGDDGSDGDPGVPRPESSVNPDPGSNPDERTNLAGLAALAFDWDRRQASVGVILGRPYWGRGYAGACARALTAVAFDLDVETVAIGHEVGNERSRRAIERFVDRVGGEYDGRLRNWTPVGETVAAHRRYVVTREAYRAAADGDGGDRDDSDASDDRDNHDDRGGDDAGDGANETRSGDP